MEDLQEVQDTYKERLTEAADQAHEQFDELAERAKVRAQETWQKTSDWVRENPAAALGAALVGGVVVGSTVAALLAPRRSTQEEVAASAREATPKAKNMPRSLDAAKESLAQNLTKLRDLLDDAIIKLQ